MLRRSARRHRIRRLLLSLPSTLGLLAIGASVALGHNDRPPVPTFPGVLLPWTLDPLPIIGVAVVACAYLWAERLVAQRHRANPVPRYRRWLFLGGLAAILLALVSPVDTYGGVLFSVHMVQHMLLEMVAAPLIVLSAPITLALRAAGPSARRALLAVLHSHPARWLTFPLVTWFLFAAVNWGWHFSALYNVALENDLVHYFEHASFLIAALLFWWPAIGPDPQPWHIPHPVRLMYLFLAMPQNSFLGVALLSTERVLYLHYVTVFRTWGPTPLDDQHLNGGRGVGMDAVRGRAHGPARRPSRPGGAGADRGRRPPRGTREGRGTRAERRTRAARAQPIERWMRLSAAIATKRSVR